MRQQPADLGTLASCRTGVVPGGVAMGVHGFQGHPRVGWRGFPGSPTPSSHGGPWLPLLSPGVREISPSKSRSTVPRASPPAERVRSVERSRDYVDPLLVRPQVTRPQRRFQRSPRPGREPKGGGRQGVRNSSPRSAQPDKGCTTVVSDRACLATHGSPSPRDGWRVPLPAFVGCRSGPRCVACHDTVDVTAPPGRRR